MKPDQFHTGKKSKILLTTLLQLMGNNTLVVWTHLPFELIQQKYIHIQINPYLEILFRNSLNHHMLIILYIKYTKMSKTFSLL